jgi:biopolymer transport protein ExbB/biopolymer transport protein TolQ
MQQLLTVAEVGASAVLYVLLTLSVVSIAVAIDRWVWFRRRDAGDLEALGRTLVDRLFKGDFAGAAKLLQGVRSVETEVLGKALEWYHDGPDSVAEIVGAEMRGRKKQLESGLLFLGTLGNNAPFLGLFGTVLGIVVAFRELGAAGQSGNMTNVMGGIAEALVSTAVGILVALPAVVAYNVFQKKAQTVEENVESLGNQVLAQMKSVRQASHAHLTMKVQG